MTPQDINTPFVADLYGEILLSSGETPAKKRNAREYVPGLITVAIAAAAATWFSEHYKMPVILAGLLIGLAMNFVSAERKVHPGLDLCGTSFLRWGIVLLGTQVTLMQIGSLGFVSLFGLLSVMLLAITAGLLGARIGGQSHYAGWLAGGATAICGASAALAIYAIIGKERLSAAQFTLTLVVVSLCSAVAMTSYPILASYLNFSDRQAGFLMGAAIHDVAQSLGGGFSFSPEAGKVATIVKLSRVTLLAPIVAVIGLAIGNADGGPSSLAAKMKLPWFVLAFFGLVAANSVVAFPTAITEYSLAVSKALLLFAVTATAMRSRLDLILGQGWRALVPVMLATITAFVAACGFAWSML